MFSSSKPASKIETIVGSGTEVEGNIQTTESVRVDGKIKGTINAESVVLGAEGVVLGDITANKVVIGGKIKGNITAAVQLELLPTGQVLGDIRTNKLLVADGANFEGNCQMVRSDGQVIEMNSMNAIDVEMHNGKKNFKVISDGRR